MRPVIPTGEDEVVASKEISGGVMVQPVGGGGDRRRSSGARWSFCRCRRAVAPPPPPNCSAADLAGVATGVTAATSAYLFTHPDVNGFFTSLKGLPREDTRTKVDENAVANPQVKAELEGIRQPAVDIRNRCG